MLSGIVASALVEALDRDTAFASVSSLLDGNVQLHSISSSPVRKLTVLDWNVVISEALLDEIRGMRRKRLPEETGGVTCGTVGLRGAVESAIAKTLDQIRYVGEWHSHPRRTSTCPSRIDLEQIAKLTGLLAVDECPALMLIVGDDTVSINLADAVPDRANE
jgi:proteasome lid subunit RPN8/RPN11